MNEKTLIILLHQLLFQGLFVGKNLLLRRRLGTPIRGGNPEANRAVLFFAVFIAIALGLAWSGSELLRLPLLSDRTATGLCLLLLAVNLAIGGASLKDLGDSWRVGVIEQQRTELVVDGVYRFTRNPYFLAYLLMFAAYTVLLQNGLLLVLACIGFGMVHAMVTREERYLDQVHGEAYQQYCRRVPRYLLL